MWWCWLFTLGAFWGSWGGSLYRCLVNSIGGQHHPTGNVKLTNTRTIGMEHETRKKKKKIHFLRNLCDADANVETGITRPPFYICGC
jgi:hypothetical protein